MSLKQTERRRVGGLRAPRPFTADGTRDPEKKALSEIVARLRRDFTDMSINAATETSRPGACLAQNGRQRKGPVPFRGSP